VDSSAADAADDRQTRGDIVDGLVSRLVRQVDSPERQQACARDQQPTAQGPQTSIARYGQVRGCSGQAIKDLSAQGCVFAPARAP
jgi:hypothetical protein